MGRILISDQTTKFAIDQDIDANNRYISQVMQAIVMFFVYTCFTSTNYESTFFIKN